MTNERCLRHHGYGISGVGGRTDSVMKISLHASSISTDAVSEMYWAPPFLYSLLNILVSKKIKIKPFLTQVRFPVELVREKSKTKTLMLLSLKGTHIYLDIYKSKVLKL
jgi:hypothetical protein